MKLTKTAWESIGRQAGWINAAKKNIELEMGIKVEKEHLDIYKELKNYLEKNNLEILWTEDEFAEKVAKAHLKEMKNYYTELKKMESKSGK